MRPARRLPRLRTVFVAVNVVLLLVPLSGVLLLRLYESVLVRRTEAELIGQGALVAAALRAEVKREVAGRGGGPPGPRLATGVVSAEGGLAPLSARLDLARDEVLPAAPPAKAERPAEPVVASAASRLSGLLREAEDVGLAGVRVVDPAGVVVASTGGEVGLSLSDRVEVQRALSGEPASVLRRRGQDEESPPLGALERSSKLRVVVALPVVSDGRSWGAVVLSRTPPSVLASLWRARAYLALWALAMLSIALALGAYTSRRVTRPVEQLIDRTERLARGDRTASEPLDRPGTEEIGRLSEAFSRMARTIEERSDYITSFAAQVSHEFKTPLTSIRAASELLREHAGEMTDAERERFLTNIQLDAERLGRLVVRLLELARADVSKPVAVWTKLPPLLEAVAARFRELGLDVELRRHEAAATARLPGDALETILANLLDNARRHGGDGVRVELAAEPDERAGIDGVRIEVRDDGPGISEANLSRVFTPFFTTARDTGGTGLGLSIVRSLLQAHGGTIDVTSRPGETVFRFWLPS